MIPSEVWWICLGAVVGVFVIGSWRHRRGAPELSDKEKNHVPYQEPSTIYTDGPGTDGNSN